MILIINDVKRSNTHNIHIRVIFDTFRVTFSFVFSIYCFVAAIYANKDVYINRLRDRNGISDSEKTFKKRTQSSKLDEMYGIMFMPG